MTTPETPLVSVVVPVYNNEETIGETVASVLAQDYPNLELIVVDDGSTDASADIARDLADGRTTVVSQENGGTSAARNTGLELARGPLISFLDADDAWYPERTTRLVGELLGDDGLEVVGHLMRYATMDGRELGVIGETIDAHGVERLKEGSFVPFQISSALFRTDSVRDEGGFDQVMDLSEDLAMYTQLAQRGRFFTVNQVLGIYRIHDNSASAVYYHAQRKMIRFNIARAAARKSGGDLSFEEFDASYRLTLNDRRIDVGRGSFRSAGVSVAEREWLAAIGHGVVAMGLVPIYSIRRIRQKLRNTDS